VAASVIKTEVLICAAPERVWAALTDFDAFPSWNPFIVEASGGLLAGEQIKAKLALGTKLRLTITPRLTVVRDDEELRWLATLPVKGLFDVDRSFTIIPDPERGGVRFTQAETCTGLLRPLVFATDYEARVYRGYDALNAALRQRVQ
jgi:hypothetical protein